MASRTRTRALRAAVGAVVGAGLVVVALGGPIASAGDPPKKGDPTGAVVTWEATPSPEPTTGAGTIVTPAVAAPASSGLDFVGLSRSCRFFNTKVAGGSLKANVARDLPVLDANLATGLGPCGIPADVEAILVSFATYKDSPSAAGKLRAGVGGVNPAQVVIQFKTGQAETGLAYVPVSDTGRIRVLSSATTHAWGDIEGYFVTPPAAPTPTPSPTPTPANAWTSTWGRVSANGLSVQGYGITSVAKDPNYAGDYYVTFNRTVGTACAASVYMGDNSTRALGWTSANQLYVDIRAYNSMTEQDGGFEFVLNCTP